MRPEPEVKRGAEVVIVPGLSAYRSIEFSTSGEFGPDQTFIIVNGYLVLDENRGRYTLARIEFSQPHYTSPLTVEGIRAVPIERIVTEILRDHGVTRSLDGVLELRSKGSARPAIRKGRGFRYGMGDRFKPAGVIDVWPVTLSGEELRKAGIEDELALGVVATTYIEAQLSGSNPAEAVATALDCSPASAGRFIKAAKRRGYLPTTEMG
jgi:hypothetical protein